MIIVIPQLTFESLHKLLTANKSNLQCYLQKGNEFSVVGYQNFSDAKALFETFFGELNILEGAKTPHFTKKCIMDFKVSVDDALLTYFFDFFIILLSINHVFEAPNILDLCKKVLAFKLDKYAESSVVNYFKYLMNLVVAKLIICPGFNYDKSSALVGEGLSYAQSAHTVAIDTKMSAPKLGAIYFLLAAYYHLLAERHSSSAEERDTHQDKAYVFIGRGLSNLGIVSAERTERWKAFDALQKQLERRDIHDHLSTRSGVAPLRVDTSQHLSMTIDRSNQFFESNNLSFALAHPDAFMLLTHIINNDLVAIFSHEKLNASILRQLCDKCYHWLFTQQFTSDEIVECCANANYFQVLKELPVKNYMISNNISLKELQNIPVEELMRRVSGNCADVSISPVYLAHN